ncbi:MAG: outer membrane protein assembly factor BamD [Geobacter sp.]|nr:outer membrane protein assembly factor BamD [Geobacter sp.]
MKTVLKICTSLVLVTALAGCAAMSTAKNAADYFKEGEDAYSARNYDEAIAMWKKVKESYFSPELTTQAELKIADAQYQSGSYIEAAASYEEFRKLHPTHEKAAYALFRQGMCQYHQITGIDTDQTPIRNTVLILKSFISIYPDSEYAKEAREKLDEAVAMQLKYEIYVGRFYLKNEKYQAAINRLEGALKTFSSSPHNDETLLYLGEAYLLSGDKAKGKEIFNRLSTEYPASPFLKDASSFMEKHY